MIQTVSAPINARQMLSNFAMFDSAKGLPSMLNRIDFQGVTRRQIFFNTLGRPPERANLVVEGPNFNARQVTAAALQGEEFQSKIREVILNAFPDKRRLIFVHVPKCAGSDLLVTLRRLFPYLHQHIAVPEQTPKANFFELLRDFAIGVNLSDSIAISGHVPLRWYTERNLVRFEDEVFSTVRHPRDIIYSYISFILTRFVDFKDVVRADTTAWLNAIGLTKIDQNPTPEYLADIGRQLLRSRQVTGSNIMCHHLGSTTAASAFDLMAMTDIEVTDTTRYSQWRLQKFGFEPGRRVNPSQPFFTPEIATAADRAFIEELIGEDVVLYEAIMQKLNQQDELSIRGRVFA
jgi:hypothetical protein